MSFGNIAKQSNGRWRARYRDANRKEHSRNFGKKIDAEQWLRDVSADMRTGKYVDPARSKQTIGDQADVWLTEHPEWSPSTALRNKGVVENHLRSRWGNTSLADLRHEHLQAWVSEAVSEGKLSAGSIRKNAGVLSSILNSAVAAKRLASNPMSDVKLPRQTMAPRTYLTAAQVEALAEAAGVGRGDVVNTLAYTGLRFGELAALRSQSILVTRRRLQVDQSVTLVNGQVVFGEPKDYERRTVPFPEFLLDTMRKRSKLERDALAFTSTSGTLLRGDNIRRDWFDRAAKEIGVPGLTPHDLRHTAASLAISAGASVLAVQRMLGHSKPSTTLDVYSDLFDHDLDGVAVSMNDLRAASLRQTKGKAKRTPAKQSPESLADKGNP